VLPSAPSSLFVGFDTLDDNCEAGVGIAANTF
jgi:hypothetical protein